MLRPRTKSFFPTFFPEKLIKTHKYTGLDASFLFFFSSFSSCFINSFPTKSFATLKMSSQRPQNIGIKAFQIYIPGQVCYICWAFFRSVFYMPTLTFRKGCQPSRAREIRWYPRWKVHHRSRTDEYGLCQRP